VELLQ